MRSLRVSRGSLSCSRLWPQYRPLNCRRISHSASSQTPTDDCGIPLKPTWSVNELLSSYPSPKLEPKTINRLYELSALIPPEEGTPKYADVKKNLEEMVRLVEAVRLVDTAGVVVQGRREKEDADRQDEEAEELEVLTQEQVDREEDTGWEEDEDRHGGPEGTELLKHASRTRDGFYVVESERRR